MKDSNNIDISKYIKGILKGRKKIGNLVLDLNEKNNPTQEKLEKDLKWLDFSEYSKWINFELGNEQEAEVKQKPALAKEKAKKEKVQGQKTTRSSSKKPSVKSTTKPAKKTVVKSTKKSAAKSKTTSAKKIKDDIQKDWDNKFFDQYKRESRKIGSTTSVKQKRIIRKVK